MAREQEHPAQTNGSAGSDRRAVTDDQIPDSPGEGSTAKGGSAGSSGRHPSGTLVGYARTSTSDQDASRQVAELEAAGCTRVFIDEGVSGMQTSRPQFDAMLEWIRSGDEICVLELSRLGRRTSALTALVENLDERGVGLRVLNIGLDLGSISGRLVLQILSAVAEMERSLLVERTVSGMRQAERSGKRIGRPPALNEEQRAWALELIEQDLPISAVARRLGCSDRTIRRLIQSEEVSDE